MIWMGEFGRTPRINGNGGRDHWARAWSVVLGGAGIRGGAVIGETNEDGTRVLSDPYTSADVLATVYRALGVTLDTPSVSRSDWPMDIASGGRRHRRGTGLTFRFSILPTARCLPHGGVCVCACPESSHTRATHPTNLDFF